MIYLVLVYYFLIMSRLNLYINLSKFYQSTAIVPEKPVARKFQTGYGRRVRGLVELTINGIGIAFVDVNNLTQNERASELYPLALFAPPLALNI